MESWIKSVSPQSGGTFGEVSSSNVSITLPSYRGRANRSTSLMVKSTSESNTSMGSSDGISQTVTINQAGVSLFFTLESTEVRDISNEAQYVYISFTTNAKSLTLSTAGFSMSGVAELYTNGYKQENWTPVNSTLLPDIGVSGSFGGYFKLYITENPDKTKQRVLEVTLVAGGDSDTETITKKLTIKQGTDYYITVNPNVLNYTSDGGVQSINITSNVEWKIS